MPETPYKPPYETRGTRKDINNPNRLQCEARGGKWDEASQTCIIIPEYDFSKGLLNQPKQIPPPAIPSYSQVKDLPQGEGEKIPGFVPPVTGQYDASKGGFVTTDGKIYPTTNQDFRPSGQVDKNTTFNPDGSVTITDAAGTQVNLSSEEYKTLIGGSGNLTNNVKQAQQGLNQNQFQIQQAIKRAQLGLITSEELAQIQGNDVDLGQAGLAGLTSVVPGFLGGQATSLAARAVGTGIGAGAGAAAAGTGAGLALGAIGAFGGFLLGVRNSIKGQQTVSIAKDEKVLKKGEARLKALIADTNLNPENAPENIALFYKTLNAIDIANARLSRTANDDLSKALSVGGFDKLAEFQIFNDYNRDFLIQKFNVALTAPNPQLASQLTQEDYDLLKEALEE